MLNVKFCKDCRFCSTDNPFSRMAIQAGEPEEKVLSFANCMNRKSLVMDDSEYAIFLVSGKVGGAAPRYKQCTFMRQFDCGEDAVLFEPLDPG